jgi:hypothetical protein
MSFQDATSPHRTKLFRNKFNGTNYVVWMSHLREALRVEGRLYVLDNPLPTEPPVGISKHERMKHIKDEYETMYLILTSVSVSLTDELMYLSSQAMIEVIRKKFLPTRHWRFEILKEISKKMKSGGDVVQHVERLRGYIDRLGMLGYSVDRQMAIDTILISLPDEYEMFINHYNRNVFEGTVPELKDLLLAEEMRLKREKSKKRALREACEACDEGQRLLRHRLNSSDDQPESSGMLVVFQLAP